MQPHHRLFSKNGVDKLFVCGSLEMISLQVPLLSPFTFFVVEHCMRGNVIDNNKRVAILYTLDMYDKVYCKSKYFNSVNLHVKNEFCIIPPIFMEDYGLGSVSSFVLSSHCSTMLQWLMTRNSLSAWPTVLTQAARKGTAWVSVTLASWNG